MMVRSPATSSCTRARARRAHPCGTRRRSAACRRRGASPPPRRRRRARANPFRWRSSTARRGRRRRAARAARGSESSSPARQMGRTTRDLPVVPSAICPARLPAFFRNDGVVAEGTANLGGDHPQHAVGHAGVPPHGSQQVVLLDQLSRVLDQATEDRKCLRGERHTVAIVQELLVGVAVKSSGANQDPS